jgi:hypothetical protein
MDVGFANERDRFIVVYLDDMTIFSRNEDDHLKHLQQVFKR